MHSTVGITPILKSEYIDIKVLFFINLISLAGQISEYDKYSLNGHKSSLSQHSLLHDFGPLLE